MVGFGEQGALLHVDVAAGDARPVTVTAFVPLSELSWSRVQSAHDAVEARGLSLICRGSARRSRPGGLFWQGSRDPMALRFRRQVVHRHDAAGSQWSKPATS